MDVNVFVEKRKELKISQVKLCKGICTQSTLSKFESNGRVPSLAILNKLCARLGLTVDDLYQNSLSPAAQLRENLDNAERELMVENYRTVVNIFDEIKLDQTEDISLKMQYYYLHGLLNALIGRDSSDILFDFSQILDNLDENHQTIFAQLAYTGSGVMYERMQKNVKADFYFDKVYKYIETYRQDRSSLDESDDNFFIKILTIVFFTSEYLSSRKKYQKSDDLIKFGTQVCSDYHVTYHLPRLKLLAAENAIDENKPSTKVYQLMNEAVAFARINNNQVIEVRVAALKKQYEAQE